MSYFDDMTDKAAEIYGRRHELAGNDYDQPNRQLSGRVGNTVTLRNVNGVLAKFRGRDEGRLTWKTPRP